MKPSIKALANNLNPHLFYGGNHYHKLLGVCGSLLKAGIRRLNRGWTCVIEANRPLHQPEPLGWHEVCNLSNSCVHCPVVINRHQNTHKFHDPVFSGGEGGVDVLLG